MFDTQNRSKARFLDLNLLLTFVVLWDTRSVSRASEQLSVTQPAVSHALKRLRGRLGDSLFVPGRNGLTPTDRAIELINPVRKALEQIYQAIDQEAAFVASTAQREFRIATLDFVELWLLPTLLENTMREAPGIAFRSMPVPEPTNNSAVLEAGDIDVIIDTQAVTGHGVSCKPLSSMPLATLIRKSENAPPGVLPLELFLQRPHVVSQQRTRAGNIIEQALSARGYKRQVAATAANNLTMAAIAAQTGYICSMPLQTAQYVADILDLSVHEPPVDMQAFSLFIAWHKRFEADPAHLWLIEKIIKTFDLQANS